MVNEESRKVETGEQSVEVTWYTNTESTHFDPDAMIYVSGEPYENFGYARLTEDQARDVIKILNEWLNWKEQLNG